MDHADDHKLKHERPHATLIRVVEPAPLQKVLEEQNQRTHGRPFAQIRLHEFGCLQPVGDFKADVYFYRGLSFGAFYDRDLIFCIKKRLKRNTFFIFMSYFWEGDNENFKKIKNMG